MVEILPNCKSFPELSHSERMTAASLRGGNAVALVVACIAWHPAFAAAILARDPPQPVATAPVVLDHLRPVDRGIKQPVDLLAGPDRDLDAGLMDLSADCAQPLCPEEERPLLRSSVSTQLQSGHVIEDALFVYPHMWKVNDLNVRQTRQFAGGEFAKGSQARTDWFGYVHKEVATTRAAMPKLRGPDMVSYAVPPQFDEAVDKWPAYQIRLEAFFEGNGVTDGKKKRALLVAALSTNTVDVISGRCAPAKVNELPYSEVVSLLQQHFSPKLNETAQSYKFFSRNQLRGEPVRDFVVAIRQIADTCNFGDTLDRMLKDRIVCGLQNSTVRRQLLAKPFLTRTEAEEVAVVAEMAEENVKEMQRATTEDGGVHAVGSRTARQKWRETESPCSRSA
ncbi:uncharacterized protein ISCGN_019311 [Ixodes scapularis]